MSGKLNAVAAQLLGITPAELAIASTKKLTYAERLGWPAGTRVVIFHVDDAGMCHDSNMGAIRAIEEGLATSISIMMPCSWVPEIADYCTAHPEIDAGLHLTLNSEFKHYRWGPVAGRPAVPGLVDENGYFWDEVAQVVSHATPDELETEIRAQVELALSMGLKPTHVDSHMGTCFRVEFFNRYLKVALEKKIPLLFVGGHMQHIGHEAGKLKPLMRVLGENVWRARMPVIDDLVVHPTNAEDYAARKAELIDLLRGMKPGITQIIVHCVQPTDVFPHISDSGPTRHAELRLMTDPDVKAFIEDEGIVLSTWKELKQRRDRAAAKPRENRSELRHRRGNRAWENGR